MYKPKNAAVAAALVALCALPGPGLFAQFSAHLTLDSHGAAEFTPPFQAGVVYQINMQGTYTRAFAGQQADAEWYQEDLEGPWVEEPADPNHDVVIDDLEYAWWGLDNGSWAPHQFSPTHEYRVRYTGEGAAISLRIFDLYYGDNSGSLSATIDVAPDVLPLNWDVEADPVIGPGANESAAAGVTVVKDGGLYVAWHDDAGSGGSQVMRCVSSNGLDWAPSNPVYAPQGTDDSVPEVVQKGDT